MKNVRVLGFVGLAVAVASLAACGNVAGPDSEAPEFAEGTGQDKAPAALYPPGPYGIGKESTIENFAFVGYVNAKVNGTNGMQAISLADFYNPHAFDSSYQPKSPAEDDRLFPPTSQYAPGQRKPTVLLIDVASVWCGPCNAEAKDVLPGLYAKYAPCGGQFLLQLADGIKPGTAATPKELENWAKKYKVDYPASLDPSYKLNPLFSSDAFPTNMIIDTTTMKIVEVVAGAPFPKACSSTGAPCKTATDCGSSGGSCQTSDFWKLYESLLDKSAPGCDVQ